MTPFRGFVCDWLAATPTVESSYSTGSSMVMMLTASEPIWRSVEYSVVVLPEPVGPVTRRNPLLRVAQRRKALWTAGGIPSAAKSQSWFA